MKQPTQPLSPLYARGRVRWHNLLTVLIICRARADTDAAHRIQIEKLEDQVRSATEFKVCTPNKRKCHGKRRGGGEGEGEGAKGEWPLLYKHFLHSHLLPYRTGLTYAFYKGVIMKTYVELLLKSNRV